MKKLSTALLIIICIIGNANAQTINVPGDYSTIQAGIDAATDDDTVLVAEGTYKKNIDFKGKAITVASQFIIEGDESHISKTIIDGSQPANPEEASTVSLKSGEDTTSVLTGFTITGGSGTHIPYGEESTDIFGGGIIFEYSGGKVVHNIIEGNDIYSTLTTEYPNGAGIAGVGNNSNTIVIADNIIRNNSIEGNKAWGGGICIWGSANLLVENNSIINNTLTAIENANGGGLLLANAFYTEENIDDVIIRNNMIIDNYAMSENSKGVGGGIAVGNYIGGENVQVYNNVIAENNSEGVSGGMHINFRKSSASVYNNTIYNNEAIVDGNSIGLEGWYHENVMYNNIIWSDADNGNLDFYFWPEHTISVHVYNNLLTESFGSEDRVTSVGNFFEEPLFKPDS